MRMKKNVLSLLILFAATVSFTFAQTVVFSDNFDSYTAGSHLAQSNSSWTTWNNAPGGSEDGVISTAQAFTAPNSLLVNGNVDQVYPFGNYTTGHYSVSFNMYIPSTGNGGYFNIQHVLLQQWSFECYFYNNGSGYLKIGGSSINFTYPSNAWFPVVMDVDMDQDEASLTINNVVINSWPFHYTADATTGGVNQLAGIDLFAGSPTNGVSGTYYVDDFVVTEFSAAQVGQFSVPTESVNVSTNPNSTSIETVTLSNPGTAGLDFLVVPTFDIPNPNPAPTGEVNMQYSDFEPYTFLGFTSLDDNSPIEIAVCFPASMMQTQIGKTLNEIDVFMLNTVTTAKVRVYAMNNRLMRQNPGEVIYEQTFTPDSGWNHIQLTTPVVIDGSDLWIGVWMLQPSGVYPIAIDGYTGNEYSGWLKSGNTWNSLYGSDYPYNMMIAGKIDGTPITPWLTVSPTSGSINAGDHVNASVTVKSNGMEVNETHTAKLHFYSTDLNNGEVIVPVSLSVTDVSVNEHNQIEVKVYPNPATDYVQVNSENIERVEIFNMLGQQVFGQVYGENHVVISTTGMAPGNYVVKVTTSNGAITKQVVIK